MLKPKKKITKKEIQKDPFLERLYLAKEYYSHNQQLVIRIGLGVIIAATVIFILNNNRLSQNNASEAALGKALVSLNIGDKENAMLQMELIIDEYTGTKAAQRTLFMLGKLFYEQKDYLAASSYLKEFLDDPTKEFRCGAHMLLWDIESKNGNTISALDHIQKAVDYAPSEAEKEKYTVALSSYYLKLGRYDEAKILLLPIYDHFELRSDLRNRADEIIGYLHTVNSDVQ